MKKLLLSITLLLSLSVVEVFACTNLIVGKKASIDGSVICTYNCDSYGMPGSLRHIPGGFHQPGEKVLIRSYSSNGEQRYIPQVPFTYTVNGLMNEKQLCIMETTFAGRTELQNREGWLNYFTLMELALQRCATAREAIQCMADLVAEYGYSSTGETLSVCDKNEAWIMEIIGKGPGRKGAVWVALRIPDDCICAHANISRIRQFPLNDPENCIYSEDVISFAREMGFFNGKDKDFSFRDAYCPIDFENVRYADLRVWSFFRHHSDTNEMDKYIPYLNGEFDKCDHLPLWIKPNEKLSVRDIMQDMRDHFEGTPFDMTADMSAGPWGMPVRPMPMTYQANGGKNYFVERPIATQKTGYSMVGHIRGWLPDKIGGVLYFNCDDSDMIAYVPIFNNVTEVPDAFKSENNIYSEFSTESAFWMNNFVANMIYPRYSVMIGDLRDAQKELEDYYAEDVEKVTEVAMALEGEALTEYLNSKIASYTDKMMNRWKKLAKLLIVKHNDLVMMPSENGELKANARGGMTYPGYNQNFYDQIGIDLGTRYEMKELIIRPER